MTKLWEVSDETSTLYRYRSENGDIISRGASRHSNPRSPPPKHAYYLPHSSPSTPSTTNSNSPATAFQKALEHDQEAAVTQLHYAHPRPHQALTPASTTLKRNNNVTTISHREIVGPPLLKGAVTTFNTSQQKTNRPGILQCIGFFSNTRKGQFQYKIIYKYITIACVLVPCVCVAAPQSNESAFRTCQKYWCLPPICSAPNPLGVRLQCNAERLPTRPNQACACLHAHQPPYWIGGIRCRRQSRGAGCIVQHHHHR